MSNVYNQDGIDHLGRIGIDAPRVDRDTALELMCHHLQLAAMYFEAIPDDNVANRKEIARLMRSEIPKHTTPAYLAAQPWYDCLEEHYEQLRKEQGDEEGEDEA